MGLGVMMGKTQDMTLAPVHAHINLLIWASMFLYGLFYRAVPKAASGVLPAVHFVVNVVSVGILIFALGRFLLGDKTMEPLLAVSSIATWASMLLFAFIVFRATWRAEGVMVSTPREVA